MNPKVSILIVTYNHSKFLAKTLQSVISQTYNNWEIILINNGSTDNTDKIVRQIYENEKRIRYINKKLNKPLSVRLNEGLKIASGDYIATLDSDDLWINRKKLKKQVDFLNKNADYKSVGTWVKAIDLNDKALFDIIYPYKNEDIKNNMLKHNCVLHSSNLIRKSILQKIGGFDTDKFYALDYALLLEIGTHGKVYNIPEIMVGYRINQQGLSYTRYKTQIKETINTIKKYKNKYPNYIINYTLWSLRRYYPVWIRYELPKLVGKNIIS